MKTIKITSEQLHCPECKTIIPLGQTKCPNPNCPTNRPILGKIILEKQNVKLESIKL